MSTPGDTLREIEARLLSIERAVIGIEARLGENGAYVRSAACQDARAEVWRALWRNRLAIAVIGASLSIGLGLRIAGVF